MTSAAPLFSRLAADDFVELALGAGAILSIAVEAEVVELTEVATSAEKELLGAIDPESKGLGVLKGDGKNIEDAKTIDDVTVP